MKVKNRTNRRIGALQRLKASVFFEKKDRKGKSRSQEDWQTRKDKELGILERIIERTTDI